MGWTMEPYCKYHYETSLNSILLNSVNSYTTGYITEFLQQSTSFDSSSILIDKKSSLITTSTATNLCLFFLPYAQRLCYEIRSQFHRWSNVLSSRRDVKQNKLCSRRDNPSSCVGGFDFKSIPANRPSSLRISWFSFVLSEKYTKLGHDHFLS
jgi:hypothetical protein